MPAHLRPITKKIKNNPQARNAFITAVDILMETGYLPDKYLPHNLSGEYKNCMECHFASMTCALDKIKKIR